MGIANRHSVSRWILYGFVMFTTALIPLVAGPDQPRPDAASVSMTMTAMVVGFATILSGIALRRISDPGFDAPLARAAKMSAIPVVLLVLATEVGFLQAGLLTTSLTLAQWVICLALAVVTPLVIEVDKALTRRKAGTPTPLDPRDALAPSRARG